MNHFVIFVFGKFEEKKRTFYVEINPLIKTFPTLMSFGSCKIIELLAGDLNLFPVNAFKFLKAPKLSVAVKWQERYVTYSFHVLTLRLSFPS